LLLSIGEEERPCNTRFFFQTWWFEVPGFGELLRVKLLSFLSQGGPHTDSIDGWQWVARNSRQFLKGWGANLGSERKAVRANLLRQVENLDKLADDTDLAEEGWAVRYHLEDQLLQFDKIDEELLASAEPGAVDV
jgi:hypothetical protein